MRDGRWQRFGYMADHEARAESQQTAIAILHHGLAAVPGHVAKSSGEFHALGVVGIECVAICPSELEKQSKPRCYIPNLV